MKIKTKAFNDDLIIEWIEALKHELKEEKFRRGRKWKCKCNIKTRVDNWNDGFSANATEKANENLASLSYLSDLKTICRKEIGISKCNGIKIGKK